jgi:hypothetical protein
MFDGAHYILCKMNDPDADVTLRARECIDFGWIEPEKVLSLGTVMDLRRIIPVFRLAGFKLPDIPTGLQLATPDDDGIDALR